MRILGRAMGRRRNDEDHVNKREEEYLDHVKFERFKMGMSGREGS